jgi:hypothetical protein
MAYLHRKDHTNTAWLSILLLANENRTAERPMLAFHDCVEQSSKGVEEIVNSGIGSYSSVGTLSSFILYKVLDRSYQPWHDATTVS